MATYTDNYQFTKPTYAEIADVQTFNNNMTKIDQILHASQVSLAPAYDSTKTYNAGDVVMYELLMYECQEDGVTGVWDPTKWGRTTAGEHGGGSDVEPNPTGEPTATLNKLGIEGTIYGIEGSGGGNVYGAFIDTNRVIEVVEYVNDEQIPAYTASEDCWISIYAFGRSGNGCSISVDSVHVSQMYFVQDSVETAHIYIKRGQSLSLSINNYYNITLRVYGLTFGTNNIFTPQIYSTEEREVGVWTDNKPLYAKTYLVTFTESYVDISIDSTHEIKMLDGGVDSLTNDNFIHIGYGTSSNDMCGAYEYELGKLRFQNFFYQSRPNGWLTTFYTKTTDTAGSGLYNTLGVPMVHYSTDEQVIGTWTNGKTLYQKTYNFSNLIISKGDSASIGTLAQEMIVNAFGFIVESSIRYVISDVGVRITQDSSNLKLSATSGAAWNISEGSVTIQYTKITD